MLAGVDETDFGGWSRCAEGEEVAEGGNCGVWWDCQGDCCGMSVLFVLRFRLGRRGGKHTFSGEQLDEDLVVVFWGRGNRCRRSI